MPLLDSRRPADMQKLLWTPRTRLPMSYFNSEIDTLYITGNYSRRHHKAYACFTFPIGVRRMVAHDLLLPRYKCGLWPYFKDMVRGLTNLEEICVIEDDFGLPDTLENINMSKLKEICRGAITMSFREGETDGRHTFGLKPLMIGADLGHIKIQKCYVSRGGQDPADLIRIHTEARDQARLEARAHARQQLLG